MLKTLSLKGNSRWKNFFIKIIDFSFRFYNTISFT